MQRTILSVVFFGVVCAMLAGCGSIDRDPSGLNDPGSTDMTRQHHQ